MASTSNNKKPEPAGFNIQSFIRVRPLSQKEKRSATLHILNKKEIVLKSLADNQRTCDRTLRFDRVFDESIEQVIIYNTAVKPLVKEVLQGYNCTVFAYGQTGTGKTYTMTGEEGKPNETCITNVHAGIIPRALEDIFEELEAQNAEYQVSVVYLELYNERLRSLLNGSSEEEDIKLEEDSERRVNLKGIHPTPVESINSAYKLLQEGAEKRKTASTNMNVKSSRSHTIFTINVTMKEAQEDGADYELRLGKLNLVDLAGSENVSKSGANEGVHKDAAGVNQRLAEASNINKSLLVLGRVIKSLTINNSHIPYRESKLTRLLQDSLGGCTKTCIIGTISPAHGNIDESENTLNYALMARSIQNKPVKNRMISRKHFLKEASEEIANLKRDLEAQRLGQGFFISQESHDQMQTRMAKLEEQRQNLGEKYQGIKEKMQDLQEEFDIVSSELQMRGVEHQRYIKEQERLHQDIKDKCLAFEGELKILKNEIQHREYLIKKYEELQETLTKQASDCQSVIEMLWDDSRKLHEKIERQTVSEQSNIRTLSDYKECLQQEINKFEKHLGELYQNEKNVVQKVTKFAGHTVDLLSETSDQVKQILSQYKSKSNNMLSENINLFDVLGSTVETHFETILNGFNESLADLVSKLQTAAGQHWRPQLDQMTASLQPVQQFTADTKQQLHQLQTECQVNERKIKELRQQLTNSADEQVKIHQDLESGVQSSVDIANDVVAFTQQSEEILVQTVRRVLCEIAAKALCGKEVTVTTQEHCSELKHRLATDVILPKQTLAEVTGFIDQAKILTETAGASVDKINARLETFQTTKETFNKEVTVTLDNTQSMLSNIKTSSGQTCETVSTQVSTCLRNARENTKKSMAMSVDFVGQLEHVWGQQKKALEETVRAGNSGVVNNQGYLQSHQERSEQDLAALTTHVSHVTFKPYQPQGTTPQRRATVEYPRELGKLDTQDLRVQACLSHMSSQPPMEEASSATSDCTMSSSATTISSAVLQESRSSHFREASSLTQKGKRNEKKIRRSMSLTDLSEDKENVPQLQSRSAYKGKKLQKQESFSPLAKKIVK